MLDVLESMLTPGVGDGVIKTLNMVFLALFLVLILMVLLVGSIHYGVMLFFAGGLFFSVQFFLLEASKNPNILKPSSGSL